MTTRRLKVHNHAEFSTLLLQAARDEKAARSGRVEIVLWSGETVVGEPAKHHVPIDLLLVGDDQDREEMRLFLDELFNDERDSFTTDLADLRRSNMITWRLVKG